MQSCWHQQIEMRPTASRIVERLVGPSIGAKTTSSTTDWDDESTSKFRRSLQAAPLLPSVTQIERMLFGDGNHISSPLESAHLVIQRLLKVFPIFKPENTFNGSPSMPGMFPR
jgi:hypothetical protein